MKTKDEGIKKVIDNNQTDYQRILVYAREWVNNKMRPFTADDLRKEFEETNTAPKQPKIYGAVFNSLSKERLILENGTTISIRPAAHGRLIRKWISIKYSITQSNNRKNPDDQINLFNLQL